MMIQLQQNKKRRETGKKCHARNCRGYKKVTIETIMSMKSDKTVKKITHHVPPRQMIYTKKQNPKTTKLKLNP
jgi:hypothetical protein